MHSLYPVLMFGGIWIFYLLAMSRIRKRFGRFVERIIGSLVVVGVFVGLSVAHPTYLIGLFTGMIVTMTFDNLFDMYHDRKREKREAQREELLFANMDELAEFLRKLPPGGTIEAWQYPAEDD